MHQLPVEGWDGLMGSAAQLTCHDDAFVLDGQLLLCCQSVRLRAQVTPQ
jgi:hypothetical protein